MGEPILDARYQLERRLGQGGMGVVFQARHIFLKTSHAIKVILPDLVGNDPMLVTRFRQEALAAAAIRHPNIIAVTDFGVVRGTMPFLVMEFVSGKSLQEMLAEEGAMPPARALELMNAIGAGVAAAHRQNIVHRDLKPLNIMAQDKLPVAEGLKILDFGLAKIKSGELLGSFVQAKTTGLMGSPFYMAPEQWSDDEPDARADVYSLGIILYQMLAGDVPFKGSSIPSIMKKHLTVPPPTFQSMGVQVEPRVEAVVRHALEKEVGARTSSVGEFLIELREAVNSTSSAPAPVKRDTDQLDPNRTIVSPVTETTGSVERGGQTNEEAAFDSFAGTVNSAALDTELQQQLADSSRSFKEEHDERERVARTELAREAEARREAQDAAQRKQREEDERLKRHKEQQEAREREHRDQLERVARQATDLEEKLARLATSISPTADPERTQLHRSGHTIDQSLSGAQPGERGHRVRVDIPEKRRSPALLMGVAVIAVVLVGGAVAAYLMKSKTINTNGNGESPTPASSPAASPASSVETLKADLAEIPGGTFEMGRNNGMLGESPAHPITVAPFSMDKTEVTNAEYAEFIRETHHAPPAWNGTRPPYGTELWPVLNVNLEDVNAFAAWRSKRDGVTYRLPTEQEWEYAARNGSRSDLYPWGPEWKENSAVLKEATPLKVGSHPEGNNRWGVQDLIGNVWEWTSSKTSAYPGNTTPIPTSTKDWNVIRGGGYDRDPADKNSPVSSCLRTFVSPESKIPILGFRLVLSAQR
ncbi:MAG: SUMF1/EgtB/PvdO family nonheme iron enzyme [bacterium]